MSPSRGSTCGRRARLPRRCERTRPAGGRSFCRFIKSAMPGVSATDSFCLVAAVCAAKARLRNWRRWQWHTRDRNRTMTLRRCFLPSRRSALLWLLDKEWRELLVSRAWWVMLIAMGPLVGMSFIGAVRTYSEVSGLNGTSAGVGEALSPLIGVWAPTFSACQLAAGFL